MDEDKEIQAISKVNAALKDLSEEERYRVIQWVANKYVQNATPLKLAGPAVVDAPIGVIEGKADAEEGDNQDEPQAYDTFAEMLDASGASKDTERFLVAAYWLQTIMNEATWKSFEVNKLLKDTGNQIDRISNPIRGVTSGKPALVVQVSKNSTSKGQGSKTLKLTTEGVKKVENMLGRTQ